MIDLDFDFDMTALGIALLVTVLVIGSMVGVVPSVDWSTTPVYMKIMFGALCGPMTYMLVSYQINK